MSTQAIGSTGQASTALQSRLMELRHAVDTTVGQVFYGTLLKNLRNSSLKGQYGHGGRGEEVFQGQLHQVFAERAGAARSYGLNDALYKRLAEPLIRKDQILHAEGRRV